MCQGTRWSHDDACIAGNKIVQVLFLLSFFFDENSRHVLILLLDIRNHLSFLGGRGTSGLGLSLALGLGFSLLLGLGVLGIGAAANIVVVSTGGADGSGLVEALPALLAVGLLVRVRITGKGAILTYAAPVVMFSSSVTALKSIYWLVSWILWVLKRWATRHLAWVAVLEAAERKDELIAVDTNHDSGVD